MHVRRFREEDAGAWDQLVADSWNGTFLHSRKFLSYHGSRFEDASMIIEDEKKGLCGVFPAALDPSNLARVVSHPGITFGGIVHAGGLQGAALLAAAGSLAAAYREDGRETLRYKPVPYIYHRVPAADDLYVLFRMGATRCRCDLSATIDLHSRPALDKARRYCLRKSAQLGVEIKSGAQYFAPLWAILEENLSSRYGVRPVHSFAEIELLQSRFPANIECVAALLGDEVVAGVVLFDTPTVSHTQYIAASKRGRDAFAQDLVFDHCISRAAAAGKRYFDFGISNERDGTMLNEGLYKFKCDFGGGGVVQEFYDVELQRT